MSPSILFITLDSCRYDAFVEARAPNLKSLAPLCRAQSPSHFTYGAHAAFFMGFTPGDASRQEAYVNPKYGKIFRMEGGGHPGLAPPLVTLSGHNIIDGLKKIGYRAIGTGAVSTIFGQENQRLVYWMLRNGVARLTATIAARIANSSHQLRR